LTTWVTVPWLGYEKGAAPGPNQGFMVARSGFQVVDNDERRLWLNGHKRVLITL